MGDISVHNDAGLNDGENTVTSYNGQVTRISEVLNNLEDTIDSVESNTEAIQELRELINNGVIAKTAAEWASQNPALQQGILGYDITNKRLKIGDGFNDWNDLKFIEEPGLGEIRLEYGDYESFRTNIELTIN